MTASVWQRIRAVRKAAGLTQRQFGARIGCSQPSVAAYESEDPAKRTDPPLRVLARVAEVAGLESVEALMAAELEELEPKQPAA